MLVEGEEGEMVVVGVLEVVTEAGQVVNTLQALNKQLADVK